MQKDKKNNQGSKGTIKSVIAGIAGAAIGAAAVALSDKKTRRKIGIAIGNAADQGKEAIEDFQNEIKDEVSLKVKQLKEKAREIVKDEEVSAKKKVK